MRIRTIAVAAGALLALSGPGAYAAESRIAPEPNPATHAGTLRLVTHHKKSKHVRKHVQHAVLPRVIYVPPYDGPVPVVADDPAQDCVMYMVDCTDQQACDLWGMNCDLVPPVAATDAAPDESASAPDGSAAAQPPPADTAGAAGGPGDWSGPYVDGAGS